MMRVVTKLYVVAFLNVVKDKRQLGNEMSRPSEPEFHW